MRTLRRHFRSFAKLVWLLVLLAPVWLGPAMMPLIVALGGSPDHHCACGMKRGECGCPECIALERAHADEQNDDTPFPTVRRTCDDDGVSSSAPATPCFIAASPTDVVPSSPSEHPRISFVFARGTLRTIDEPPTPPPRHV